MRADYVAEEEMQHLLAALMPQNRLGGVDGYGVTDRGCLGNAGSKGEGIEGRSFDGSGIEDGEDAAGSVACGVAGTDASAGRENLCVGGAVRPGTA